MGDNIVRKAIEQLKNDATFNETKNEEFYYLLEDETEFNRKYGNCRSLKNDKAIIICDVVQNTINEWDEFLGSFDLDKKKCCYYLIYWLYGKISENNFSNETINLIYYEFERILTKKCFKDEDKVELYKKFVKSYDVDVLKNKKVLYDFLEHFSELKRLLENSLNDVHKKIFCDYITYVINIYQKIELNNDRVEYCPELIKFEENFKNTNELDVIRNKCSGSINLKINGKNKEFCLALDGNPQERAAVQRKNEKIFNKKKFFDNNLKDVPYNQMYDEFNKEEDNEKYKEYCNDIINLESYYNGINNLCNKLTRNLINVSNLEDEAKRNDACSYFIHWLYDQLMNLDYVKSDYRHSNPAIRGIYDVVIKINMREFMYTGCYVHFDYTLEQWKDWKILHDYFKNCDCIIVENTDLSKEKCEIKCEDLYTINELYGKYIKQSCTFFSNEQYFAEHPEFFECNQKCNPYNLYIRLKCNDKEPNKIFNKVNPPESIEYYSKYLTEKSEKERLLDEKIPNSFITSMVGDDISYHNPFYTIVLATFSLLGIFTLFFLFYKFTPFGTWIHRNNRSNKKYHYNHYNKFKGEVLDKNSRPKYVSTRRGRVSIAYQNS
ncbi:variable surface protein [Plasmodium gonderi]|uniref:Variable surface protein n=1 Tax=Plasmodium gonderi TaxID=77519 RepID=A0A1Y1JFI2_PLAGO|nr:variable surface protein [Plasmodium gonderi]GAW79203.1 variable surface protein [Plasmodium gonderi]